MAPQNLKRRDTRQMSRSASEHANEARRSHIQACMKKKYSMREGDNERTNILAFCVKRRVYLYSTLDGVMEQ
jgi:hypothetical protein